ncbi:MAG: DUF2157 domain-containing protein [Acidobacteriota bacterium]
MSIEPDNAAAFEAAHVSYYLGALLIIGAMGWFVTSAWDRLSGTTIVAIAAGYAVAFGAAGFRLYRSASTRIPGGLLVTVAVCMTPLAVYGIERAVGWWPAHDPGSYTRFHPYINVSWVLMEIATAAAAAAALYRVRFPFLTAPAAYALWYFSMDATALIFGTHWTFHQECWISVVFGAAMIAAGYFVDGRSDRDFAFWFYLFGVLTFSGGLTVLGSGNQVSSALYCLIHLLMIAASILLERKVFLVFGSLGVFLYLAEQAANYFANSFAFTFSLTAIGILFMLGGFAYARNEAKIQMRFSRYVPRRIRKQAVRQG